MHRTKATEREMAADRLGVLARVLFLRNVARAKRILLSGARQRSLDRTAGRCHDSDHDFPQPKRSPVLATTCEPSA